MIQIGLLGSQGRMGKWVSQLIQSEFASKANLAAQPGRDEDFGPLLKTDVIIEFSSPAAVRALIQSAARQIDPLPSFVLGSTGWNESDQKEIEKLSTRTPVFTASNFSTGVFAVSEILKKFSPLLKSLGYTPVLVESHHHHKKDAPSGTALLLQRAIDSENPSRIQTHSIRAGEVIGEHKIIFYGPTDQIVIQHSAQDRSIFARGAIEVALWLAQNRKGRPTLQGRMGLEHYFSDLSELSNLGDKQ